MWRILSNDNYDLNIEKYNSSRDTEFKIRLNDYRNSIKNYTNIETQIDKFDKKNATGYSELYALMHILKDPKLFKKKIETRKKLATKKTIVINKNFDKIEDKIKNYKNIIENYKNINIDESKDFKNIFIAGATGYLGIYLLKRFLNETNSILTLLIRGKDVLDSRERLKKNGNFILIVIFMKNIVIELL
jgi:hypothetical protein